MKVTHVCLGNAFHDHYSYQENLMTKYHKKLGYDVDVIYVVGGACSFKKFESIFEQRIGVKTIKPKEPLLVTPLGIAMNCNKQ